MEPTKEQLTGLLKLREPVPASKIGKIPKGGAQLDYVGHADVTHILLDVDPLWTIAPAYETETGPARTLVGGNVEMWFDLTVCGVTRRCVGVVKNDDRKEISKELISDAIRNGAMRFGVALDLWSKSEAHEITKPEPVQETPANEATVAAIKVGLDDIDDEAITKIGDYIRGKYGQDMLDPRTETAAMHALELVGKAKAKAEANPVPAAGASREEIYARVEELLSSADSSAFDEWRTANDVPGLKSNTSLANLRLMRGYLESAAGNEAF